jgi:hypothetical protein
MKVFHMAGHRSILFGAVLLSGSLILASCDAGAQTARRLPASPPSTPKPPTPASADNIIPQASVNPCALPASTVSAAFGTPFSTGTRMESFGSNTSCQYKATNGRMDIRVKIAWLPAPSNAREHQNWVKYLAPTMTPVTGDPDNANFQWQADLRTAGLHYFRKNLIIEYRVMTVSGDQNATRAQLLALPRIP